MFFIYCSEKWKRNTFNTGSLRSGTVSVLMLLCLKKRLECHNLVHGAY